MIAFEEYLIETPLTPQQRLKRARIMKRLAPKIAIKRKLAMKKKANPEKIKKRAQQKARDIVRAKLAGGKNYNSMSFAQRSTIDKKIKAKDQVVKKLAKKLIPKIKKAEQQRLKNLKAATETA